MADDRRLSVRSRVVVTFGTAITASAVIMLALVAAFMALVPHYAFEPAGSSAAQDPSTTPAGAVVADTVEVTDQSELLRWLVIASGAALLVVLVVGSLVMNRVARQALLPVTQMNVAVRNAAVGEHHDRVDVTGPDDEVSGLATTFNVMLDRLECSLEAQRRFTANASHELQTPLATTQALIDVALRDAPAEETRTLLRGLRQLNSRSIDTVRALLDLADAENSPLAREALSMTAVVDHALAAHADEARARGVTIRPAAADPEARVFGDRVLAELLVSNIVTNAIRHNTDAGWVEASIVSDEGGVMVTVKNSGSRLGDDVVAKIGEPFFRARGRTSGENRVGHGLGGALIAAIADRHGWTVDHAPQPEGGLEVRVRIRHRDDTDSSRDDGHSTALEPR